ncbi:MAG: UDP-N-acetylglucosamine 1-carboxyvinyltransferase, partial [Gemmatimonadota bacterium]|nr:UDP-N-acetylglucosamine 1-carboxyvinyltransferase [Gemmatimonadota bacterium]
MTHFRIEGGHELSGRFVPTGNKNAALPILAATLLTEETVVLENVPRIQDVDTLLEILRSL